MKLYATDDLLSKYQDILDPVLIMFQPMIFFKICIAAVVLVDNDVNTKFLLYRKKILFEANEMLSVMSLTSGFARNEN